MRRAIPHRSASRLPPGDRQVHRRYTASRRRTCPRSSPVSAARTASAPTDCLPPVGPFPRAVGGPGTARRPSRGPWHKPCCHTTQRRPGPTHARSRTGPGRATTNATARPWQQLEHLSSHRRARPTHDETSLTARIRRPGRGKVEKRRPAGRTLHDFSTPAGRCTSLNRLPSPMIRQLPDPPRETVRARAAPLVRLTGLRARDEHQGRAGSVNVTASHHGASWTTTVTARLACTLHAGATLPPGTPSTW